MQLLFLRADPPTSGQKQTEGRPIQTAYTPGTLAALCLGLSLVAVFSLPDWGPGAPAFDPHTHNLWFVVLQGVLIFLMCWLSMLVGSLFHRQQASSSRASQQATIRAIQQLLFSSGMLFLALVGATLISKIARGHIPPASLLAFLPLLSLLRFRPEIFTFSWISGQIRSRHPLIGTGLVDFSITNDRQMLAEDDGVAPDPDR
ncbi:MAG TPA: hypothetical protein VGF67_18880 [Ktedonobacteraceae bacterium]|jgi:hypothetical protein